MTIVKGTLEITKATLTVTAENKNRKYGEANPAFTFNVTGFLSGDNASVILVSPTGSTTASVQSNVGSYPISFTGGNASNYSFAFVEGTLTVQKATPILTWSAPQSIVYGQALAQAQLNATANVDGSFVYNPPVGTVLVVGASHALQATFTPTDAANYESGNSNTTIQVTPAALTARAVNLTKRLGASNPTLQVDYVGLVNGDTAQTAITTAPVLTTTATVDSVLGDYPITFVSAPAGPNYTVTTQNGTLSVTLNALPVFAGLNEVTIDEDTSSSTIEFSVSDPDDANNIPSVTVTSGNLTILPSNGILVGGTGLQRTVRFTPAPNQFGVVNVTFSGTDAEGGVREKVIQLNVQSVNDLPSISAISTVNIQEDGVASNLEFAVNDVETSAANLVVTRVTANDSLIPQTGIQLGGNTGSRTVSLTPLANQFGSSVITLTVTDADGGIATSEFTLNVASVNDLPVIGAISDQVVTEDGTLGPIEFTISDVESGLQDIQLGFSAGETLSLNSNSLVFGQSGNNPTFTITPLPDQVSPATITITATDPQGGQSSKQFNLTITPVNDAPVISPVGPYVFPKNTTLGPIPVTISDVDNAANTLDVVLRSQNLTLIPQDGVVLGGEGGSRTFSLTPALDQIGDLTLDIEVSDGLLSVTNSVQVTVIPIIIPQITWATPSAITYGAALGSAQLNASTDVAGSFAYTPVAGTILGAGVSTLSSVFTPSDLTRYAKVTNEVSLIVQRKALQISVDSKTKTYGSDNPSLTAAYSGFVNGETPASLDVPLAISTPANRASGVANYDIVGSNASDPNYQITIVNGSLSVVPATLTITAENASRPFGQPNPNFSLRYEGFVVGDSLSSLVAPGLARTSATSSSPSGTYSIRPEGAFSQNYVFRYVEGTLTVDSSQSVITWVIGGAIEFGTPLGNSELNATANVLGTFTYTPPLGTVLPVGTHTLRAAFQPTDTVNNRASESSVTLQVRKKMLQVVAGSATRVYGSPNPELTFAISGFINNDNESSLDVRPTIGTPAVESSPAGDYVISVSGGSDSEYDFVYVPSVLRVTKASPRIAWSIEKPVVYGTPIGIEVLNATSDVPGSFDYLSAPEGAFGVGTYLLSAVFTPSDVVNYLTSEVKASLTILPANVRVSAKPVSRPYGESNPPFELTYSGFVLNQDESVLTTTPTVSTVATEESPGGIYEVRIDGAEALNYSFSYSTTTLTVLNALPVLGEIQDVVMRPNTVTSIILNVSDVETTPIDLNVTATHTPPGVLEKVVASSGSANKILSVHAAGPGRSTVKVTMSDGTHEVSQEFHVVVESVVGSSITTAQGTVIDGYISGALVFLDADLDGTHDGNEPSTITDGSGKFTLNYDIAEFDKNKNGKIDSTEGKLVMLGGIDIASGVKQTSPLVAPAGSTVITPLTTLVSAVIDSNPSLPVEDAAKKVSSALGIPADVSLIHYDAVSAAANNDPVAAKVINVTAKVHDTTSLGSAVLSGSGQSASKSADSVTSALASAILSSSSIDLSNGDTTKSLLSSAADKTGTKLSNSLLNTAAEILSNVNQVKDQASANTSSAAGALEVSRVQGVVQGKIASDLAKAAAGQVSAEDVAALNSGQALLDTINDAPVGVLLASSTDLPGRLNFSTANFQLSEDGNALEPITIHRTGGSKGIIRGFVQINSNTSASLTDFTASRVDFIFEENEISKRLDLDRVIVNDSLPEGEEAFDIALNINDVALRATQLGEFTSARLSIVDDESAGTFEFASTQFKISESLGTAPNVVVRRTGGSLGSVTLKISITEPAGNPAGLKEFSASSVMVTFAEGVLNRRVVLPLVNDRRIESEEASLLSLSIEENFNGLAKIGAQQTSRLLIMDDDANSMPTAVNDSLASNQGEPLIVSASVLLNNDIDTDEEDLLSISEVSSTTKMGGVAAINNGSVLYLPRQRFYGTDEFSYVVADKFGGSSVGKVTVNVARVNAAPVAAADTIVLSMTTGDVEIDGTDLLLNDFDSDAGTSLKIVSVSALSANGGTVKLDTGTGNLRTSTVFFGNETWTNTLTGATIRYQLPSGFKGSDSFSYTVADEAGKTSTAAVTLKINSAPTISTIAELHAVSGLTSPTVSFTVADGETSPERLIVRAESMSGSLLATRNVIITGSGGTRFLSVRPESSSTGTANVKLTVIDAQGVTASTEFSVVVTSKRKINDLDGDGLTDIILAHPSGYLGYWSIDKNKVVGAKLLEASFVDDTQWQPILSADFNNDGRGDIVFQHVGGDIGFWLMDGTQRLSSGLFEPSSIGLDGWSVAGAGDINSDGYVDLVLQHRDGILGYWTLNGTKLIQAGFIEPSVIQDSQWKIVGIADFDLDGKSDFLFQHSNGTMGIWFMEGSKLRKAKFLNPATTGDEGWQVRFVGDLDQDGDADIVFQYRDGTVAAWLLGGQEGIELQESMLLDPNNPGDSWKIMSTAK